MTLPMGSGFNRKCSQKGCEGSEPGIRNKEAWFVPGFVANLENEPRIVLLSELQLSSYA